MSKYKIISKIYDNIFKKIFIFFLISLTTSCVSFKKVDARKDPISGPERAKRNIEEGRGVSIANARKSLGGGSQAYEFSTSNPLWRASLETLDFLPLTTVDYSGGIIITDWYQDNLSKDNISLKLTVRFLSNEIRADSFKVIVHQKKCSINNNCVVNEIDTRIKEELLKTILSKATTLKQKDKKNN